jgi:hypothetical protein
MFPDSHRATALRIYPAGKEIQQPLPDLIFDVIT